MDYVLQVADANANNMMVLNLDPAQVQKPAIDVVFDILGNQNPEELVNKGILPEGQLEDFKVLQSSLFDQDEQGLFIREGINLMANGKDLNPDATMAGAFIPAKRDGIEYRRCDLSVGLEGQPQQKHPQGSVEELGRLLFLHQIAIGKPVDVTRELAELSDLIAWAEAESLIDIDVQKAAYKLTDKGKRRHDSFMEEAQSLILRYDIFDDVDVDTSGNVYFDTGLGQDLRVPIFDLERIDPYRARFLLGLNDGEWDSLENWTEVLHDENWYRQIFTPIDQAPAIDDIGREKLQHILEAGKARLRQESY